MRLVGRLIRTGLQGAKDDIFRADFWANFIRIKRPRTRRRQTVDKHVAAYRPIVHATRSLYSLRPRAARSL